MLKLYNTLTRKKEIFRPIKKGNIGIYVCGPTVYDYCHLGHAKGYVSMDVIRRYLEWSGFKVKYVQNFTDVGHLTDDADMGEDKIEKRAKEKKINPLTLANQFVQLCVEDFEALNIKKPDHAPRPTQFIKQIIDFTQSLIEKGYAYEAEGSVYFDVTKFKEYGKLSGRKLENMLAGARVEVREEKKNPFDFALWIKAEPGHILKWESPWSVGYPGWHIECSVMSRKYLGDTFDIHGGGNENIFPHNEDEIAQSEALTGKQMAHYWLHWNMVRVSGVKMSKSKGNFTTVKEILRNHDPMVVRLSIIKSNYRSPIDFNEKMFEESKKNLELIHLVINELKSIKNQNPNPWKINWIEEIGKQKELFKEAMTDDFNTSLAFSRFFGFIQVALNDQNMSTFTVKEAKAILGYMYDVDHVFGINLKSVKEGKLPLSINNLIKEREKARKAGDFKKADKLRAELLKKGIELEDTPQGVKWKRVK